MLRFMHKVRRPAIRALKKWYVRLVPERRRLAFSQYYSQWEARQVGLEEDSLLEAIRTNINTNGGALYNLCHAYRWLRETARIVGQDFHDKTVLEIGTSTSPGLPLVM